MNKQIKKLSRKDKEKVKSLWSKSEKRVLIIVASVLFFALLAYYGIPAIKYQRNQDSLNELYNQELAVNKVCMVGDEIKFKVIRPVKIEGKTYWACCSKCEAKLNNNLNDIRNAIDPFSKEIINKADAVVVQNPTKKGRVLFFKTYNNYDKYIAENNIEQP
ncbi:hypothetical protein [uncultured Draconibacterium sp.]|jgi:hypothetical protein|uniref:hypothetical protein n=1 Tax=uncultured Draconibacterium sp. TaxID=1573823 RepID=UPI0032177490